MDKLPYKCGLCNHAYQSVGTLKRHKKNHHSDTRFHCADCNKSYCRSDVLYKHRRRAHPTLKARETVNTQATKPSYNIGQTTKALLGLTSQSPTPVSIIEQDLALSSDSDTSLPDHSSVISKVTTAVNTDKTEVHTTTKDVQTDTSPEVMFTLKNQTKVIVSTLGTNSMGNFKIPKRPYSTQIGALEATT